MKFTKRPVVIDAVQWFKHGDHPSVERHGATNEVRNPDLGWIKTLEGGHIVTPGDWIITGASGEQYPCKSSIFSMTYDPAALPVIPAITSEQRRLLNVIAEKIEDGTLFQSGILSRREIAAPIRAVLAIAPAEKNVSSEEHF